MVCAMDKRMKHSSLLKVLLLVHMATKWIEKSALGKEEKGVGLQGKRKHQKIRKKGYEGIENTYGIKELQ